MLKALRSILHIQELDMKLIQLMRLKSERIRELDELKGIKNNLERQIMLKRAELEELKMQKRLHEGEVDDVVAKIKELEKRQSSVKKLEEFNALTHEMAHIDKERIAKEQRLSDLIDSQNSQEDALRELEQSLANTCENGRALEVELIEGVERINEEGSALKIERDALVADADVEVFEIYERLLRNKRDRVVVPIENRCCTGCHITLTPQHENLVRKGERLVFCEHCARIHFWPESTLLEETGAPVKARRRRSKVA